MDSKRLLMLLLWPLLAGGSAACGGSDEPRGTEEPPDIAPEALALPAPDDDLHAFVVDEARALAARPFRAPDPGEAARLATLTYGQVRAIRFRADSALWKGEAAFEVQFFHPGGGFVDPVRIASVASGQVMPLPVDLADYDVGVELDGVDLTLPPDAGPVGFRVLHPMNDADRFDEIVSFLGASYFRLVGPGQVYGLSSRGVAVDVGGPDGEEFPAFVAFWLERPEPEARSVTFYGLLDGPSLSGAYRFDLTPGDPGTAGPGGTVMEVDATLYARRAVPRLGVAPLTSMYLHGTFRSGGVDDVRPRVHDSEGLLMETSRGEWIWRPLTNRAALQATVLRDRGPRGFGLVQRSRTFADYLDLEAQYHRRPSQWVEPLDGNWGDGGVALFEIPTASEFADNIVAYWAPDGGLAEGEERRFRYRLRTFDAELSRQSVARVARTRIGWDGLPGQADPPPRTRRRVVVDFEGGSLPDLGNDVPVEAVVSTSAGTVEDVRVQRLPDGGRRATFALIPDGDRPADMRLLLRGDEALTETWSYLWKPDDGV
ncbi:MAG: glucan biosynthesis protein [Gemmatimonadetes bacterium]|nr:glucan biosynthesis protein [Gemmatimonadota bacterium]